MCAVRSGSSADGSRRGRDPRQFPGSGWTPTSPPIAFPVYGLAPSRPGARWLDGFGDAIGDPPRWAALAHEGADGRSLIMVNTWSKPPTDVQAARLKQTPLENVAFDAAHILINLTLPAQSASRPVGFIPLLMEHAAKAAGRHALWPSIQWQVDGASAAARVCRLAGGWATISDAVDDVYLSAVGVGAEPEGLSLAQVRDGSAYHFDLAQPLNPGSLTASRQAAGKQSESPEWQRQDWHAEQGMNWFEPALPAIVV